MSSSGQEVVPEQAVGTLLALLLVWAYNWTSTTKKEF